MYIDSSACVRIKGGESETEVYHVSLAVQCIYGWSDERGEDGDRKEGSDIPVGWKIVEIAWPLVCRCSIKLASGRRVAGAIRSHLVDAWDLQLKCARVLHKTLIVPVLMYGSEKMIRREKERSRVRAV